MIPEYQDNDITVYINDSLTTLKELPSESINCCITSPPYFGLRSYLPNDSILKQKEIGLEETLEEYIEKLINVFVEVKRILKPDGTLWLNLGDSYCGSNRGSGGTGISSGKQLTNKGSRFLESKAAKTVKLNGIKPKDLIGVPWSVAFALRDCGYYLRQDIIWNKVNSMPEPIKDRCVKSHEYIFLFSKSKNYYFDYKAIQEKAEYDGRNDIVCKGSEKYKEIIMSNQQEHTFANNLHERWNTNENGEYVKNKRSVWSIPNKSYTGSHYATFPIKLINNCVLAGCPNNGIILDPFIGSGTTAQAAIQNNRKCIGIDLNKDNLELIKERTKVDLKIDDNLIDW